MKMASRRNYEALHAMGMKPSEFLTIGRFPRGVGIATLSQLVSIGWAEEGFAAGSSVVRAWRITLEGGRSIGPAPDQVELPSRAAAGW